MNEELMQVLARATSLACQKIASRRPAALQASLDQARAVPAHLGWERKAAAHAEFFNALADAAGDPRLTPVLGHCAGLAYDLMITAGRGADGIVTNSRKRVLAHLRTGDVEQAGLEMEKHLRVLYFMTRLTGRRVSA
jgi:DNA-binding GntR family transcriptional regulator